jgi:hypothetical protein
MLGHVDNEDNEVIWPMVSKSPGSATLSCVPAGAATATVSEPITCGLQVQVYPQRHDDFVFGLMAGYYLPEFLWTAPRSSCLPRLGLTA